MNESNGPLSQLNQQRHLGRIDNPYSGLDDEQLEEKVNSFCDDKNLPHHKDLFLKAAWIIRDRHGYELTPKITPDEIEALENEPTTGLLQQPKQLQVNMLALCFAAITSANGANLGWPQSFGIRSNWVFGGINAATYFAASLVGCWLSDPLNEVAFYKVFFGRRAAICTSAIIILGATIGCAAAQTLGQLLGFRIMLGIGMGSKAAVVPVYTAEIVPSQIRGSLVMTWQLFDAFGLFLGFTANLAVSQTGCNACRWQIACSIIAIIVLLSLISVCVESPRFLIKHNQYPKALRTLNSLKTHMIIAARDLLYMHAQLEQAQNWPRTGEAAVVPRNQRGSRQRSGLLAYLYLYLQHLGDLFRESPVRRATVAAVVCMFGQQLCGVNVLAFYSSSFFVKIANKDYGEGLLFSSNNADCTPSPAYMQSLWFSWGIIGAVNFIAGVPAYWLIDRYGRRGLLLLALPFMCITMMAAGFGFLADSAGARAGIIGFFIFCFMFFYSWSMGPVPFTISAEVFPLGTRVPGMSFAVFTNFFGCGLLALFVPPLSQKVSYGGLLGLFAFFNVILFFLVFLYVRDTAGITIASRPDPPDHNAPANDTTLAPQTAQQLPDQGARPTAQQQAEVRETRVATELSLEELYKIFEPAGKDYRKYQWEIFLPWAWNYYVRGNRKRLLPQSFSAWAQERHAPPVVDDDSDEDNSDDEVSTRGATSGFQLNRLQGASQQAESNGLGARTNTDASGGDSVFDLYQPSEAMTGGGQSGVASSDGGVAVPPSSYRGEAESSIASRLRPMSYTRPM